MFTPARSTTRTVGASIVLLLALGSFAGCSSSKKSSTSTTTTVPTAASELKAGVKAQVAGDTKTATAKFLAVINLDPSNKLAHYDLGLIQQNAGDTKASEANYRVAIATDASYAPALYNLAILRSKAGSKAEAIRLYTRSTIADPKSAPAFLNLGLLLNATKATAAGDAALGTAIKLDPSLASRIPTTTTTPTTLAP